MDTKAAVTERESCRVCGSYDLTSLFSLGEQFVSDFVDQSRVQSGVRCPIELQLCNFCTLVQMRHTAPQDFLYTRHYWYKSGVTDTMRRALRDVAAAAEQLVKLEPADVVLDIGSNDGTLLRSYTAPGIVRVGVEPATNLTTEENYRDVDWVACAFWSEAAWDDLHSRASHDGEPLADRARILTACGMFYDLEDPNLFIADVAGILHPDGLFVAQLMCLRQTVDQGDIGNLCHEHLEFYSLRSLQYLFGSHGLEVFDVEQNTVNGGSYRLFACHRGAKAFAAHNRRRLHLALDAEERMRLDWPATYVRFLARAERNRRLCVDFVRAQAAAGKRVWVYGASTKGNVVLQWYGLDGTLIEAAADRSPEKVGKYTIGTGIPIVSEDDFRKARPDAALVLPYAFLPEFLVREAEWRSGGGKFIVPLPEFRVM